jgi:hypothetical protein
MLRKCENVLFKKTKKLIQRLADGKQTTAIMMKKYITQGTTSLYGELWDYIYFIRQNQVYVYGYVMKKLFYFLKESDFDKILFSLNTDRMVLKYAYPKKHLRYLIP